MPTPEGTLSRQFILIDPSISSLAGHHYEYAVHVLRAAEQAGYKPVLATNRKFHDEAPAGWEVRPVYKYGFWAAASASTWDLAVVGIQSALRRFTFRFRCAWRFSAWGMAWQVRNFFSEFLMKVPVDRSRLGIVPFLTVLVILFKLLRFLGYLLLAPLALGWLLIMLPLRLLGLKRPLRNYVRRLFADLLGALRMIRLLHERRTQVSHWLQEFRCLRRFARDTGRLFSTAALNEGDLVFLPTVGAAELTGLRLFMEREPRAARASWHLLFRRNLHCGRREDYPEQDHQFRGLAECFASFRERTRGQRVFFYTDTHELTTQYNRLGVFPFHTVPIPHTHQPASREITAPLRIIYVGDARREKGYPLLPKVIGDLWQDYVACGKAAFILQSNYNTPNGEPEVVVARNQLESLPGDKVRLLKEPLTSLKYKELLLSGDINLLLYHRDSYYARSSGILVEALSAGMPVLVPAGSWLARQFLAPHYAYLESLREQMQRLETPQLMRLVWHPHGKPEMRLPVAKGLTLRGDAKAYSWVLVPEGATCALVTFWLTPDSADIDLTLTQLSRQDRELAPAAKLLVEIDSCENRAVVRVPLLAGCARLWFAINCHNSKDSLHCTNLRLDFLRVHPGRTAPPLGAVGLTYQREEEISELLAELIDHYPHYRATAREFASSWNAYHNAARLVKDLESEARR